MFFDERYVRNTADLNVPAHTHFGKYILDKIRKVDGEQLAFTDADTGDQLTYGQVRQYAVNLAMALINFGVQKGDVVALGCELRCTILPTCLGVVLSGATYTVYETNCGIATVNKIKMVKPKYLIVSKEFWENNKDGIKNLDFIKRIIFLDDDAVESGVFLSELITNDYDVDKFEPYEVAGQAETAIIIYSSGTTGLPKAVLLSHVNCIINASGTGLLDDSIKTALNMGYYHFTYDNFLSFKILSHGKRIVFVRQSTPEIFHRQIEKYEVNALFIYPLVMSWIAESKETYNLSSVVYMWSATAPLCPTVKEKILQRYPSIKGIFQAYGLSEIFLSFEGLRREKMKRGSVGPLMPGGIVKVVDIESKKLCNPYERGEIWAGGPRLMKGYLGIDKSTYLDEDGFFNTGDVGYFDEDGYIFIVGRTKEIIEYNGYQVPPAYIEMKLDQYPGVVKAAVVGKPVPVIGQLPTAFVVLEPGAAVTEEDIMTYTNKELPDYMQLKGGVIFVDHIPKTTIGKIHRKKLEDLLK